MGRVIDRQSTISWLFLCSLVLTGCGTVIENDILIEADALVDGRPVQASTRWHTRIEDVFPQGASTEGTGVALAIPIANDRFVYGLFRVLDNDMLRSWTSLGGALDAFVREEDASHGTHYSTKSVAKYHKYAVDRLQDRNVELCLPRGQGFQNQSKCLVLVYFEKPNDPQSLKMIWPGEEAVIYGHRVRIARLTATFRPPAGEGTSTAADLPSFLEDENVKLGKLPNTLRTDAARQVWARDFRRK